MEEAHQSSVPAGQAGRGRVGPQRAGGRASGQPPGDPGSAAKPPSDLASLEAMIKELARPRPIYTPKSVHAVHALRYAWTGWLSGRTSFPTTTPDAIGNTRTLWQADGLALLDYRVRGDSTQILFEAGAHTSPLLASQRVKGRLQHALRLADTPVKFSRKVALRSLGDNTRSVVEGYLGKQVAKEGFVDPRFIERMKAYTIEKDDTDLREPVSTNSGQYWYNLHLVLVTSGRRRVVDYQRLAAVRDAVLRVVAGKGYLLKSLSVMPDHVHVAFRGDLSQSPADIALSFMNNLAFLLGRNRIWDDRYYVGTFSEYGADVVRELSDVSFAPATPLKAGQARGLPRTGRGHRGRRRR